MLHPIILAGGVGSRLWPLSRALLPKQFILFPGESHSLFQKSLQRLNGLPNIGSPVVISNESHRFLVAEQLQEMGIENAIILLEPFGKNTAPAVALAAQLLLETDGDAQMLVLASDHAIADVSIFHLAIEKACAVAGNKLLATFGIVPTGPETGYGYLLQGSPLADNKEAAANLPAAFAVKQFVEKPDTITAQKYVESGSYYWNSGMFLFAAKKYLDELAVHASDIATSCAASFAALHRETDFVRIPESEFQHCRAESIDYAVMEKSSDVAMVSLAAGWSDLGSWGALWQLQAKNNEGNVLEGDVYTEKTRDSYVHAQSRFVATVGLADTIVVETADAVLVADKSQVQSISAIVAQLKNRQRSESENHTLVSRPWGSYESLAMRNGYQIKHIIVKPQAALSLQMHHHRAEHWTVIKGTALVQCDDTELHLSENETTFIPQGSKHRLINNTEENIELIEVQVGEYLGEDDIVRFDDIYGRR